MLVVFKDGKMKTHSVGSQYNGDKFGNDFPDWMTYSPNPNDFILDTYDELSARCATLYHTSSFMRSLVIKPLNYIVGRGIVFKSMPNFEFLGLDREEAKEWGKKFTQLLHYDKLAIDYYSKQYDVKSDLDITGDSLTMFVRDENSLAPFDIVTASGCLIDPDKTDENYTLGIHHDSLMRRDGFWARTDKAFIPFQLPNGDQNVIQNMFRERGGQMRGLSAYYFGIAHAKNADRVWDSTIERMVLESIQLGWFAASNTDVGQQHRDFVSQSTGTQSSDPDKSGGLTAVQKNGRKPGDMYVLENKESMQFLDLKTPSNNFVNANEWLVKLFSMGRGVAPEFVLGEYSTSFTAHKGALNDTMKRIFLERERLIRKHEMVVNLQYLREYVRSGLLPVVDGFWEDPRKQIAYLGGKYLGEVPGHVNPLQEINAQIKANDAGMILKSDILQMFGHNDFDSFIDVWEYEQAEWFKKSPEQQQKIVIEETSEK